MQTSNAIKKLEKLGFVRMEGESKFSFTKPELKDCVEFFDQKSEAICLGVRRKTDHSDSMSDYCATWFCDSMAQAVRMCA